MNQRRTDSYMGKIYFASSIIILFCHKRLTLKECYGLRRSF